MRKNYCVIIDSYPQSPEDQNLLLENLKSLKNQGIDVFLTSHHPCTPEIIENSTYFLFEKRNDYHFLDSSVLNENLEGVQNPVYLKYFYMGDEVFRDKVVITGWSAAITSQLMNCIRVIHGKKYEYAFYLVSDFICPSDFREKLDEILENSEGFRNYFIRNSPRFESWYAGFFFGFTVDDDLISKIPSGDLGKNEIYQRYFPNCSGEDVMIKIWGQDKNFVEENFKLDYIFGKGNWNLSSSVIKEGASTLHSYTSSSIHVNAYKEFCLMLQVSGECPSDVVSFHLQILDEGENLLFDRKLDLPKFHWYKEVVTGYFEGQKKVTFKKYIQDKNKETLFFQDSIIIDLEKIDYYYLLKNFEKS